MSEGSLKLTHWLVLFAAFLGWMFDGFEMGLYPLAARPALRDIMSTENEAGDIVYPDEEIVGEWYSTLVSMFLLGAAGGGLVFGWLGDRMGRVRTMALSIAVYSIFTGCVCFANAPWQLATFRFLAALGMGGEWALGVALVMEYWPESLRPLLAGVIGAAANFGFLSISLLGVMFDVKEESWRWTMLVGASPAILAIIVVMFIPESERWKAAVSVQRSKPIREIFGTRLIWPTLLGISFASVALIATWGAVSGYLPVWTDQLAGGARALKVTAMVSESAPAALAPKAVSSTDAVEVAADEPPAPAPEEDGPSASPDSEESAAVPELQVQKSHFLEDPVPPGATFQYRLTVINAAEVPRTGVRVTERLPMESLSAASIELTAPVGTEASFDRRTGELTWNVGTLEVKDPKAKSWVQTLLSVGAILGCFLGPMLAKWFGRRPAYFLLCLASLISCGYLFGFLTEFNLLFLAVTAVAGLVSASFYGWLPLYLPEIFPTRVRATGQGVAFNFARILAAGGTKITGFLIVFFDGSYPKACSIIVLVYIVGMVLIWFAPETKGKPLPE